MLPDRVLSSQLIPGTYLYPDNLQSSKTMDYEYGGIALNDSSQGLMYQVWTCTLEIDDAGLGSVYLEAPNTPRTLQFARQGVTEISLTFDQNMNPFIAFEEDGLGKYWWYDSSIEQQIFSSLPTGSRSPKASLDDKRTVQFAASDIILAYVRDGSLYFRAQRDRYLVEYHLTVGITGSLLKLGMTDKNRVQFSIGEFE